MAQPVIQTSFASGEWAPKLRSRVDIQKYHAGASVMRNFFVDFAGGGASTRCGTKFCNRCKNSALPVRLIPFQPSTNLSYVLEFGHNYIRFFNNGSPILENAVTGGTGCVGSTFTIANTFAVGDWVYALNWGGMTNVNGNYFIVSVASGTAVTVTDLYGNAITFTGTYTSGGQLQRVYTLASPYNAGDLLPNQQFNNPGLKYVQDVTSMIICHPSYPAMLLTINSANNWSLTQINFGATIPAPTGLTTTGTSMGTGTWNYSYVVTSVDANGQESPSSAPASVTGAAFIGTTVGVIQINWTAVPGAVSYNIYKASPTDAVSIPAGTQYGFIGNSTGVSFTESYPGIGANYALTPPIPQNPFLGGSVISLNLTANATYTTVPSVSIAAPPSGLTATGYASLQVSAATLVAGGTNYKVGDNVALGNGVVINVLTIGAGGAIATFAIAAFGSITSGNTPTNPVSALSGANGQGGGTVAARHTIAGSGGAATFNLTWNIGALNLIQGGFGYLTAPAVTLSGTATANSTLGTLSSGFPAVPTFIQQRLMLGGQTKSLQSFNMSQPANFFNFNVSNPVQPDDAISGTIISGELDDIRWLIPVPTGVIAGTSRGAWLLSGGGGFSTINPITPTNIVAQPQAFNGANDLAPQKINFDIIYGTNKGGYFRDLTYNIYMNIYTGQDITVLSNHLFFGHTFTDVAWSEEPFKLMWVVRDDGILLSLTFVKEQEMIGWAHHDTNGQFMSVCSVIEKPGVNVVDAVYVVVQRFINGQFVQYVERMSDRYFPYGAEDSWGFDAGLQTTPALSLSGTLNFQGTTQRPGDVVILTATADAPFTSAMATNGWVVRANGGVYKITAFTSATQVTASVIRVPPVVNPYFFYPFPAVQGWTIWAPVTTSVTGLQHLAGQQVTAVADGGQMFIANVDATGAFPVPVGTAYTKITAGLQMQCDLQTLPLDTGEPTIQSKRKKLNAVTVRVADTMGYLNNTTGIVGGLMVGTNNALAVSMKDFNLGAIPSTTNGVDTIPGSPYPITDLWSGDGRQILNQVWQEWGTVFVTTTGPYPATILGIMPEITVGDTPR